MTKISIKRAKQMIEPLGYTLRKREDEFRVAPKFGDKETIEAQAYYTNDIEDAIHTAIADYKRRRLNEAAKWQLSAAKASEIAREHASKGNVLSFAVWSDRATLHYLLARHNYSIGVTAYHQPILD